MELVKILVAYIQDAYYVYRRNNFSMFVYDNINISQRSNNISSIIISSSEYIYQVPAMFYGTDINDRVFLFHPKKTKNDDVSIVVTPDNSLTSYFNRVHSSSMNKLVTINPQLMSLLMTLNGCDDKKIPCIKNSTTAINILYNAISRNSIPNSYMGDIDFILNTLAIIKGIDANYDNYVNRFRSLDLLFQYRLYLQSIEYNDITWNINLNDPNTVMEINNKYFIDCPLDLRNLL